MKDGNLLSRNKDTTGLTLALTLLGLIVFGHIFYDAYRQAQENVRIQRCEALHENK